jgi:hypothetical protein
VKNAREWVEGWLRFAWGSARVDIAVLIGVALVIFLILELLAVTLRWGGG